MAAKIINGKCICAINDLDFELYTEKDYYYGFGCEYDEYYITAYIRKYGIIYKGRIGGSADKYKATEVCELYNILEKVISAGKVRLYVKDQTLNTLIFTEEYVFDGITITRYTLELHSISKGAVCELISQTAEEICKKAAEKALLERVSLLEQENAELRAKLQS